MSSRPRTRLRALITLLAVAAAALVLTGIASAGVFGGISGVSGNPGANGWYTSPVTVSYSYQASGPGHDPTPSFFIDTLSCNGSDGSSAGSGTAGTFVQFLSAHLTLSQDGVWTTSCAWSGEESDWYSCGFLDAFRCQTAFYAIGANSGLSGFSIDTTPPDVSVSAPPPNGSHNWYKSPFGVSVSGSDTVSGIWDCNFGQPYSGAPTSAPTFTVNSDTAGASVGGGCRNNAGLRASTGFGWRYDGTAPTLAPTVSPSNSLLRGAAATASANATDALSHIDTSSCEPIDTSTVGSFSAACTATDNAGNTTNGSVPYTVSLGFSGFAAPVDNDGVLNVAKAGQAVPLIFSVLDANGPVTDLASVSVSSNGEGCDLSDPSDPIEAYAAGSSGLQNLGGGNYQFNWKTDKAFAGQCRQVNVDVGDGVLHSAQFKFTK